MNKIFSFCLLCALMVSVLVSPAYSQDAKTILDRIIDAQGGRKLLGSIKDSTALADMELPEMELSVVGTMYSKEPNMVRLDLEIMGMVYTQACDGETAWENNPQSGVPAIMQENVARIFRNSAFGNSAFLAPEKYGIRYESKGKETIDGKEYLLLERIYPDKYTITYYIDPDSYLIYKTIQQSFNDMLMEIVEETIYSDYKKIEGIMTAHSLTIIKEGGTFAVLTITDVKFNTGLEDSLFKIDQ